MLRRFKQKSSFESCTTSYCIRKITFIHSCCSPSEGRENENLLSKPKDPQEPESWINVTEEDVAQAKQATGNKSDSETMTSPVAC